MKWEEVHPVGTNIPVARYGHSCCYYNGKIYMYGGREKPRYSVFGAQGTVHCYNISKYSNCPHKGMMFC